MITDELIAVLYFLLAGIVSGIIFDIFRCKRKNFNTANVIVYIEDLFFWLIIGLIMLFTAYISTDGQIRIYMIVIMGIGGLIYFLTFSKIFYKLFNIICRYLKSILKSVRKFARQFNILRGE